MSSLMEYKGYFGTVEYSQPDQCLHGKLAYIRSLVTYEADNVKDLEREFYAAVDDYLAHCEELDKDPEVPFKGTFNVRTGKDLHRKAAIYAQQHDRSLNQVVIDALDHFLNKLSVKNKSMARKKSSRQKN